MHRDESVSPYCPKFQYTVELIGRRWSGAIVRSLLAGATHFRDILRQVPGLSDRLLSERLRELEAEGIIERHVYPEVPVRIEYTLSPKGHELLDIVAAIDAWAERWVLGAGCVGAPQASLEIERQSATES